MKEAESESPTRLDKWLWAARFFKTRSFAAESVEGGKVKLNGNRAKPGHAIRTGDELKIRLGASDQHSPHSTMNRRMFMLSVTTKLQSSGSIRSDFKGAVDFYGQK